MSILSLWFQNCFIFIWQITSTGTPCYSCKPTGTLRCGRFCKRKRENIKMANWYSYWSKWSFIHVTLLKSQIYNILLIVKAMSFQIFQTEGLCTTWLRFFELKPNYKKKKKSKWLRKVIKDKENDWSTNENSKITFE